MASADEPDPTPPAPKFAFEDIDVASPSGLAPHVIINEKLVAFHIYPDLKKCVHESLEKVILKLLPIVSEKASEVAVSACKQLIAKDYALDTDEERMREAADNMVRSIASGLACYCAMEPCYIALLQNLQTSLRATLNGFTELTKYVIEEEAKTIAAQNTELAAAFMQKVTVEQASSMIHQRLAKEYDLRRTARENGTLHCDRLVLEYQRDKMPEQIRLNVGGETAQKRVVYDEFAKNLPGFLPTKKKPDLEDIYPGELENDPYAMSLYQEAIQKGSETDNTIRVNVVGNYAQGKTSLVRRLTGQSIEDVESTNSVEINRCKFSETNLESLFSFVCKGGHNEDDSDIVDRIFSVTRKEIPDTFIITTDKSAFNVFGHPGTQSMVAGSTGAIDTEQDLIIEEDEAPAIGHSERESIEETDEKSVEKEVDESRPTERKSLLTTEEIKRFCSKLKHNKDNTDYNTSQIDLWDFGGQYIFYATHMMFHSQKAIYLLVFKLTSTLDEIVKDEEFPWEAEEKTMEYYMKFWMNSIHSFVGSEDGSEPPVYLVGTHFDQVEGDADGKHERAESYFEKVREIFDDTDMIHHIQPVDFKIDNTDPADNEIISLRNEIVKSGRQLSKSSVIPARWLPLERELKKMSKEMKIVSFDKVLDVDSKNEFPISDVQQVKLFLSYYHVKGTFFYFDEDIISDYIVLDPQYVVDAFKCIITSQKFCRKEHAFRELWNKLRKEARLEDQLIDKLWNNENGPSFIEHKDILLQFLKRHHILSEAMEYDEHSHKTNGLGWYIVPSLLKDHSEEDILRRFLVEKRQTTIRFVMHFRNSPVYSIIYHRLLAALLGKWSAFSIPGRQKNTLLFKNLAVLRINEYNVGFVECKDDTIEFWVVSLCPTLKVEKEVVDRFRRFSESVVMTEYKRLKPADTKHGTPYIPSYRCNHESHCLEGSTSTEEMVKLAEKTILPCPDYMAHAINTVEAKAEWFREDAETEIVIPDTELTAKQLSKISQALGDNWEMLGYELGMPDVQIQHITMENRTTSMRIFRMLMTWQDLERHTANMNTLVQALKKVNAVYVDWDKINNVIDEITNG